MHSTPPALRKDLARRGRRPPPRIPDSDDSNPRPATTFTSSLSIPAPGAVPRPKSPLPPIHKNSPEIILNGGSEESVTNGKRAPRKSKSDALAALMRPASPPLSTSSPSATQIPPRFEPLLRKTPISEPLDLATVNTTRQQSAPPRQGPRLFDLEDCPTYFPTLEEFQDPMEYISSIREQAQTYGICKVVPPEGWNMPFVTDTKSFRFKTRVQRLNSIEASSRAKLNFLEQLYRFHDQGNSRPTIPTISHKALDLWLLRKEVHKRGGYDHVNRHRLWGDVGRAMGYDSVLGVSTQLKTAYTRLIHPFDAFVARVRGTAVPGSPGTPQAPKYSTRSSQGSPSISATADRPLDTPNGTPNGNVPNGGHISPPDLKDQSNGDANGAVDDAEKTVKERTPGADDKTQHHLRSISATSDRISPPIGKPGRRMSHPSLPAALQVLNYFFALLVSSITQEPPNPPSQSEDPETLKGEHCEICKGGEDDLHMLLCDGCDRGFHTYCLDPPLSSIPRGQWYCHTCLFDTDYGFDEGEDHSLSSFQARADKFRRMWFETHPSRPVSNSEDSSTEVGSEASTVRPSSPSGTSNLTEDDVEREFWRLVESPYDSVEVEYGADVHSTIHGSAMPTMETHPSDPYSRDPWNLNNMPILQESLLRYIKSDISGMTVPWTYVGMIFSTFCWHNEDHYTYSVNYMHWGDTKTWYGIPGEDAEKFEAAIKSEAPELFEAQPDLLFQLVTLMSPERLRKAGVRVFAADQRAGEFVITFPKAYHAGFNHGFNFNEAVNFALPDWLPFGYACSKRYQEHQKVPVFSHDELLLTITQFSQSVKTALWVHKSLKEMTDREISARRRIRESFPVLEEANDHRDRTEDQYQCSICKTFCYLAQVTCSCTNNVACLEHASSLCTCTDPAARKTTLRTRYTDDALLRILQTVSERAGTPQTWLTKLHSTLEGTPRPPLRVLRALVQEGEACGVPEQDLHNLRKFVTRANAWVTLATAFITRKPQPRKRGRKSRGVVETPAPDDSDYSLDDAHALLEEANSLGFDTTEIEQLTTSVSQADDIRRQVVAFLALPDSSRDLAQFEVLLGDAQALTLKFPEIAELESSVTFLQLLRELDEVDDSSLTLDYVEDLLARARASQMDPEHEYFRELERKRLLGLEWKAMATELLHRKPQTIEELHKASSPLSGTPTVPKLVAALSAGWSRARDLEKQAKGMMSTTRERRSTPDEALTLINRASDYSIPAMEDLRILAVRASRYSTIYQSIHRGQFVGDNRYSLQTLFSDLGTWRAEIRRDLSMMNIPAFTAVDEELTMHEDWLRTHPWYREGPFTSNSTESFQEAFLVLQDVIHETRTFDQDLPSPDCTCICVFPVNITAGGPAAVQCDSCGAKFHQRCIAGSCPFCDHHHWDGRVEKARDYSLTDLIEILNAAPQLSKNYSAYAKLLTAIVSSCMSFMKKIDAFTKHLKPSAETVPAGIIPRIRHIMRKLYKIQFRWPLNAPLGTYGADLAVMHRTLAVKPLAEPRGPRPNPQPAQTYRKPKLTFSCELVDVAPDQCQCVCEGVHRLVPGNPALTCNSCRRKHHRNCVADFDKRVDPALWICPICAASKGLHYEERYLRVSWPEITEPDRYVDYRTWITKRTPTMPIVILPDPYPPQPSITLKLVRYSQHQGVIVSLDDSPIARKRSGRLGRPPGSGNKKRADDDDTLVEEGAPGTGDAESMTSEFKVLEDSTRVNQSNNENTTEVTPSPNASSRPLERSSSFSAPLEPEATRTPTPSIPQPNEQAADDAAPKTPDLPSTIPTVADASISAPAQFSRKRMSSEAAADLETAAHVPTEENPDLPDTNGVAAPEPEPQTNNEQVPTPTPQNLKRKFSEVEDAGETVLNGATTDETTEAAPGESSSDGPTVIRLSPLAPGVRPHKISRTEDIPGVSTFEFVEGDWRQHP